MSMDKQIFDAQLKQEAVLAEQIQSTEDAWEAEKKKENPDLNVKFTYGYVLTKSDNKRHKILGIRILEELIPAKVSVQDCMYAIAVAHYSLGDDREARKYCEQLLRRSPDHRYALALYEFLKEDQAKKDMQIGIGVTAGVVLGAGAIILGAILGSGRRR